MSLKKRIEKLEDYGMAGTPMVALENAGGIINCNGKNYLDKSLFDEALREYEASGKLIFLDD